MFRKPCKILCPRRVYGILGHGCRCFTVFAALYLEACSENHVKYGVRCAGAVSSLVFTSLFMVFVALYVEPCSENRVKYGVRCAGAVAGLTFAWFFTMFAALDVEPCSENRVKYGV